MTGGTAYIHKRRSGRSLLDDSRRKPHPKRNYGPGRLFRLAVVTMALVAGAALGAGAERTGSAPDTAEVAVLARTEQQAAPRIVHSKPLLAALRSALPADRETPTSTPDWSLQVLGRNPEEYRFWSRQQVMLRTGVDGATRALRIPPIARSLDRLGEKPAPLPDLPPPARTGDTTKGMMGAGDSFRNRSLSNRYLGTGMVFLGRIEGVSDFFTLDGSPPEDYTNYIVRVLEEYKSPYSYWRKYARIAWPGKHRLGGRAREYPLLHIGEVYLFFTSSSSRRVLYGPEGEDHGDEAVVNKNWEAGLGAGVYRIVDGKMAPPFPEWERDMLEARIALGNPRLYPHPTTGVPSNRIWEEPRYGMPWAKFRNELLKLLDWECRYSRHEGREIRMRTPRP